MVPTLTKCLPCTPTKSYMQSYLGNLTFSSQSCTVHFINKTSIMDNRQEGTNSMATD